MNFDFAKTQARLAELKEEQPALLLNLKDATSITGEGMAVFELRQNMEAIELLEEMLVHQKNKLAEADLEFLQDWRDQVNVAHHRLLRQLDKSGWQARNIIQQQQFEHVCELLNKIDQEINLLKS